MPVVAASACCVLVVGAVAVAPFGREARLSDSGPAVATSGAPDPADAADAGASDVEGPGQGQLGDPLSERSPTVPAPGTGGPPGDPSTAVEIPRAATGRFAVASIPGGTPSLEVSGDRGPGRRTVHYTVEVEVGLPLGAEPAAVAIDAVLGDERGWAAERDADFVRVARDADVRIVVASPDTTDRLCAPLRTGGEVSCRNGGLVVLNARRWTGGVPDYEGHLADYRRYLVNHEVGHALGEPHVSCPAPGQPAPVMQQQTYGLDGCVRNPWPTTG